MAAYLPFVMQHLFNTPLALAPAEGAMIAAALSGRLDIRQFEDLALRMDQRGLDDLAEMGRLEARERKARQAAHPNTASWSSDSNPYTMSKSGIAMIPVQGTLVRNWGVGPMSGSTGYDGIWTQAMHAQDNPDVKALWMDINSGGGKVDGLYDLADGIFAMSGRHGGKPIWAFAGDYAASAAYLLGAAADKFIMPQLGQVGSIGTIVMHADLSGALDQQGIRVTMIRSPEGKGRGNAAEALDAETAASVQEMVDEATEVFVDRVARYRGVSKKSVSETNAAVYTGARALATGLVNEVLPEPSAWAKLERKIART